MAGSIGAAYYLVNIPEIGGIQALIAAYLLSKVWGRIKVDAL